MPTVSPARLAEVFVEIADTLVADFDLHEFLELIVTRTAELAGVDAVGLLLADQRGQLQFMVASNEKTRLLELFQIQSREGPCLDAFRTRAAVVHTDLTKASDQWPVFAPRAVASGLRSVHAMPMRLRDQGIGALNMFGAGTVELDPADVTVVQAMADVATIGLLQERSIRRGEVLTEQLQVALNSRVTIEQAKGALSRMRDVDVDAAFLLLREYARRNGRHLGDVALLVLTDPAGVADLTSGPRPG